VLKTTSPAFGALAPNEYPSKKEPSSKISFAFARFFPKIVTRYLYRHNLYLNLLRQKPKKFLKRFRFLLFSQLIHFMQKEMQKLLESALAKPAGKKEAALLFSSGVDSLLLALLLKKQGIKFTCFFAYLDGLGSPKDLSFARKAAKRFKLKLVEVPVKMHELPQLVSELVPLAGKSPVNVGIALPLRAACRVAGANGLKTVFSGQGADELLGGYARFQRSKNSSGEMKKALKKLLEKDLAWNMAIAKASGLKLETPFLDPAFVKAAKALPKELKISNGRNKVVLRNILLSMRVPKEFAERKKLAAQYGSNFDKGLGKIAKKAGAKSKGSYVGAVASGKMNIAALFSGGKDSCLVLWKMQRQGFVIKCLVSIIPENPDSFMYHKPKLSFLKLQSKALGIPFLIERTKGEKEKELFALKKALRRAKKKFLVQGAVAGALYSSYQEKRVKRICKKLKLVLHVPLWHMGQLNELHELHSGEFSFIVSKIAAQGLGEKWLGRKIGKNEIKQLKDLENNIGFNAAGEGGEYESLVLDAPNFSKRIKVLGSTKKMQNEFTGRLEIKKARLVEKR